MKPLEYVSRETYLDMLVYKNMEVQSISKADISIFVTEYPSWHYTDGELHACFELPSFEAAIEVVNAIAKEASALNHHPKWTNNYKTLSFSLCTHDAGDQVTTVDVLLAKKISHIILAYPETSQ